MHGRIYTCHTATKEKGELKNLIRKENLMTGSRFRSTVAGLLAALALLFAFATPMTASAVEPRESRAGGVIGLPPRGVNTYSLDFVVNTSVNDYKSGAILMGGVMTSGVTRHINGEVYIPLADFVSTYVRGARVKYDSGTRTVSVSGSGYDISVSDGAYALLDRKSVV